MHRADLGRYIPNTQKRGMADITATYRGKSLQIEVKIGKDRMSVYQLQVKQEFERCGGLYYVARDFTSFKRWFDAL